MGGSPDTRFVVCTYNLWADTRMDIRRGPLAAFLAAHRPDLLCAQELRPWSRELVDQNLPGHARVDDPFEGWLMEGNIWWNRTLFREAGHGAEDVGILEPLRRLFWVRLEFIPVPGRTLLAATAHFTWQGAKPEVDTGANPRLHQARQTATALGKLARPEEPALFMGDLNEHPHTLRALAAGGFRETFTTLGRGSPPTFPAGPAHVEPAVSLDFVTHCGPIAPMAGDVADFYHQGVPPSDHKPVLVTFRLV